MNFKYIAKHYTIILSVLGLIMFTSCKKIETPIGEITPPVVTPPVVVPSTPGTVPADAVTFDLGTGSGYLTIDGTSLNVTSNAFIRIKGGNYKGIVIKNFNASAEKPVYIKNMGLVTIAENLSTDNISNVIISGDNTPGLSFGFQFENISYRAITMNGKLNGVTIRNMSFKNVNDYCISGQGSNGSDLVYQGTAATRTENFKILYCLFDNAGIIQFGGNLNKDQNMDTGLFKNVEIAYNTFQNNPGVGTVCAFSNAQDYNIHHNVVNNINQDNNNHNGVFAMQGNGIFHDNKLTNYQGNAIRMWLYSRGSSPATNEIYNNICYNTRKYGAFELQAFDRNIYPGKTMYANAKVYNNTVGQMNTSKDWEGQVLDLYNTGGSLEYYNNLGFNLHSDKTISNMINNMSDTKIVKESSNKYVSVQSDAVNDLTSFTSKFTGIGESK